MLCAVLFGKWTDHVKSWRRSELGDRIMYITYEELVKVKQSKYSKHCCKCGINVSINCVFIHCLYTVCMSTVPDSILCLFACPDAMFQTVLMP